MNKQEIVEILRSNVCKITFEKADKSVREMLCTLKEEHIMIESAGTGKYSEKVVTVWDVEKQDWRAFRIDRLIDGPIPVEYTPI
jgi:hypothetical protein